MNIIPNKYLSVRHGIGAIYLMRKWTGKYGELATMECLLNAYREAKDADKAHLGLLMAMLFDFRSNEHAVQCAGKFGISAMPSLSVGESILIRIVEKGNEIGWCKEFSDAVCGWAPLVEEFDYVKYPLIFTPDSTRQVLCISKDDGIYAFRMSDGSLNLLVINTMNDTALIDEEPFGTEGSENYPLYFTESTHFVSPVFRLRTVCRLLEFILSEVGYPPLHIKLNVVFNKHNAYLINSTEYEADGDHASDWQHISVYMRRDYPNDYIFRSVTNLLQGHELECNANRVMSKLIDSLSAVSILYKNISNEEKLLAVSNRELRKFCKKYKIFSDGKEPPELLF